jgi:hypothetical protein
MKLERVERVISQRLGELPIQEKGATFTPAGVERQEKIGDVPENSGFTEGYTLAELRCKLNAKYSEFFNIEAFPNFGEKSPLISKIKPDAKNYKKNKKEIEESLKFGRDNITIFTTGGKQYMMPNAWVKEPGTLGDGEFEIVYKSATSPRLV